MSAKEKVSSVELERLLLRRRRQEAVEGLRSLSAEFPGQTASSAVKPLSPAGLRRAEAARSQAQAISAGPLAALSQPAEALSPNEEWFYRPRFRLRPVEARRRPRRRQASHPLLVALKKGLAGITDSLIVLVLFLFVAALGLTLYDNYLNPLRHQSGRSVARAQSPWLWQGRFAPPMEELSSAPLPFVPYSGTVTLDSPYVPAPTPAPGTTEPTRLIIPRIQLDTPVVEVTIENGVWQVAQYAAGYHRGSARPGTLGNTVISGHKGLHGAVFLRLEELEPGDEIFLYAGEYHLYRYLVEQKMSVWPHQVEVMAQTPRPILTLITCTAYDTQRLVVVAALDREMTGGEGVGP